MEAQDLENFLRGGDITYDNIKELLNNVDFNEKDEIGGTPFVNISMNPNINAEIVELILKNGGDPNIKSYHDATVLHNILQNRELKNNQDMMYEIIKILLSYDADVNATDNNEVTPISFITQYTSLDVIRLLLEAGANLNFNPNFLPLHDIIAISDDNIDLEILNLLLSYGADPNILDSYNLTTLMHSFYNDAKFEISNLLLAYGADINAVNVYGKTVLHLEMERLNIRYEVIEYLLNNGADPNKKDHLGNTPFQQLLTNKNVIRAQDSKIIELMLNYGADSYIQNENGISAFFHTLHYNNEITELVMNEGMNLEEEKVQEEQDFLNKINQKDIRGRNILHFQLGYKQDIDKIKFLLDSGIDATVVDYDSNTLLHYLATRLHVLNFLKTLTDEPLDYLIDADIGEIVDLLMQYDIDINAKNENGDTAINLACKFKDLDMIKALLKYNPDISLENNQGKICKPFDEVSEQLFHEYTDTYIDEIDESLTSNSLEISKVISSLIGQYLYDDAARLRF